MKIISLITVASALVVSACTTTAPENTETKKVDTVTGATKPHKEVVLPPARPGYKVLGHVDGFNNFMVEYSPSLIRGGQIYLADLADEALTNFGVKTIISITANDEEREFCKANGYELVEVPFQKSGPSPEVYAKFFEGVENAKGPIYLHCMGGTHRAGILAAAYRMKFENWSFDKALIEYGRLGGDLGKDEAMIKTLEALNLK